MKVVVLIENTSENELICEHGLSLWIQNDEHTLLLDAGSTDKFVSNAQALGIDLDKVDTCVLSHGHYDHSGGFEAFFRINSHAKLYAKEEAKEHYFSGNGQWHEIGIPANVLQYRERFEWIQGVKEILPKVYLVPHQTAGLEKIGEKAKLYKEKESQIAPDDFEHEISLVFDTEKGFIIFNSCSHGGVQNIIREVKEVCGDKPIYAYVGGLHMKGMKENKEICTFSDLEIDSLCDTIVKENISFIYTGHCTGAPGLQILKEKLGNRICALKTGLEFEL